MCSLNIDLGCMSCSENIKYLAGTLMLICGHRPRVCSGMSYYNICSGDQIEDVMIDSSHALNFSLKLALEFHPESVTFLRGQKPACVSKHLKQKQV